MKTALSFHHKRRENEISGRLYRGAVEAAQRLEYHLRSITSFPELFSSEVTSLRMRLKDYCERLMFTDPLEYGKKAEDLLWRKVFYDFFQKCKQNGKKLLESSFHKHELLTQLLAGIGSYHHLLLRLQTEFHLDLNGKVGVPFMWQLKGVKKERWKKYQQSVEVDENIQTWAMLASHRILIYLGDLARYIRDLHEPECGHLAERYYHQAFCLNSANGTPHNQLGSLSKCGFDAAYHYMRCLQSPNKFDGAEGNFKRVLDKNTEILVDLCSPSKVTNDRPATTALFLARFLKLCEAFYFSQDENTQSLCQETLEDVDNCLLSCVPHTTEKGFDGLSEDDTVFKVALMCLMCIHRLDEKGSADISTATAFTLALFSHIVHHADKSLISSLCEACDHKISSSIPDNGNKIISSPLPVDCSKEQVNNKIVDNDSNKEFPAKKTFGRKMGSKKTINHLRMLRRRRKTSNTSQEDSELSEGEGMELPESDDENGLLNSDISETGSCSSESLSEHEEEDLFIIEQNNLSNMSEDKSNDLHNECYNGSPDVSLEPSPGKHNDTVNSVSESISDQHSNSETIINRIEMQDLSLSSEKLFQILKKVSLLPTLKILTDWLGARHDILAVGAESSRLLLFHLVELLNIFLKLEKKLLSCNGPLTKHIAELQRKDDNWRQFYPLPEDIQLQGFPMFSKIHEHISFDISSRRLLSPLEEMFLRIQCLLSFGSCLPKVSSSLVTYDESVNKYVLHEPSKSRESNSVSSASPDSMDSGYQRQQLMRSMAHLWLKAEVSDLELLIKGSSAPQLSPYLVIDTNVLVHNLTLLKQLIEAKRFIVIVPAIVITNLDRLKKESMRAREAIRWLEAELKKGCRYIRAQVPTDSLSLSPMKYPRKKDKESWDFFQILECCNFLCHQQKPQERPGCSLVTLIVGAIHQLPGNATALSESIGVSLESIEFFYSKWRNSAKNPG